jgi:hypothetical protein
MRRILSLMAMSPRFYPSTTTGPGVAQLTTRIGDASTPSRQSARSCIGVLWLARPLQRTGNSVGAGGLGGSGAGTGSGDAAAANTGGSAGIGGIAGSGGSGVRTRGFRLFEHALRDAGAPLTFR